MGVLHKISGLQGGSIHRCVSSIQIDEHAIVLYDSPSKPSLIVPESVGKEWLSGVPIESLGV